MPLRLLEISVPDSASATIRDLIEENSAVDSWHSAKNKDGRRTTSILVHLDQQQALMDALQTKLSKEKNWRITVLPVEASIPQPEAPAEEQNKGGRIVRGRITREELYNEVEKGARINSNFILLVLLSTIVAAIGLMSDNIAVVIGAMVIAPLLGPNLALAFGAALGDYGMMLRAVKANLTGLGLTVLVAALTGLLFTVPLESIELDSRTYVGFDSIVLALASGAAAVLSLTTGLSGALVGVMVAVALMPPAVAMGLYLGSGYFDYAYGAGLLLAANIICVSLSAQLIFLLSGVKPRTWYMRKKSKQSTKNNALFWFILLLMLAGLIALRNYSFF